MKAGQKTRVIGPHPHAGAQVELLSYGPYGLEVLNLVGWKVRRTDTREEFYCSKANLARI